MDGRLVDAAGFGVAAADRHVDGAADLLVEEHLEGAAVDPVVGADAELAEAAGSLIGVEQLDQVLLAPLGARVDNLAGLEAQLDAGDLAARRSRAGRWKVTSPSTESSIGPVKNSPSGMLCSPTQGMKVRPSMPRVMSVPAAWTRTSLRPWIHSASRFVSSEACFQAVSGSPSTAKHAP